MRGEKVESKIKVREVEERKGRGERNTYQRITSPAKQAKTDSDPDKQAQQGQTNQ